MNRLPKIGKTILSSDRYIIKEIELEPEESARLESQQEEILPDYLKESVSRTREILDTREEENQLRRDEEEQARKRARHSQ